MPHTTQRTHRAFRIAYWTDVQRIFYSATLTAFMHGWALHVLGVLIPSALTVLQFLAALHRSNKNGYIGTAVAYELLSQQIALATGRPCSVRTLQRGISALKMLGFISLRFWTIPDQTIHTSDGRTIKLKGTGRKEIGGGEWRSLQIRIVTLTETAIAMWDRSTKSAGSRYVGKLPTPAKVAVSPRTDQIDKSTMVKKVSTEQQPSIDPRQLEFDNAPSVRLDKEASTDELEGRPTRPTGEQVPPPTLEHRASNVPQLPASSDTVTPTGEEAENSAHDLGPDPSKTGPKGCSADRPTLQKRPKNKTAWPIGRIYVLNELHKALSQFSRRQADALFSRARFEMSRNYPSGWPTSVNWDYWVPRFASFPPTQRKKVLLSQILPLLKNPAAITPKEDQFFQEGKVAPAQNRVPSAKNRLDPFLAGLSRPKYDKEVRPAKNNEPGHISSAIHPFLSKFQKFCGDDPTD